jgi:hypothetical protein
MNGTRRRIGRRRGSTVFVLEAVSMSTGKGIAMSKKRIPMILEIKQE